MKKLKVFLIIIAVVCIGVALSYPIRYKLELDSNNSELEDLSSMRRRVMEEQHIGEEPPAETTPAESTPAETTPAETTPAETTPTETTPAETTPAESTPAETAPAEHTPAEHTPAEAAPAETARQETTPTEPAPAAEHTPATEPASTVEAASPEDTARPELAQPEGEAPSDAQAAAPARTLHPGGNDITDYILDDIGFTTRTPSPTSTPTPPPSPSPSPTPDRSVRGGPDTFKDKQKIRLDPDKILPELREIYELNHDLVGWLYIEDTNIDYPVVQSDDRQFYLHHDFYGNSNANGQIILEDKCDPYTPSYNLVLSGHHMNSGVMFGRLGKYKDKEYWETHKIVEFDTLMARKRYVVFAAFYSADYNENEKGFRYSADIQYKLDADMWLGEIKANQIYDTGVKVEFGDEFITLTTCDHSRRSNGRFVVVARRIREGETIR